MPNRSTRAAIAPDEPSHVPDVSETISFQNFTPEEIDQSSALRRDNTTALLAYVFPAATLVVFAILFFGKMSKTETVRGYVDVDNGSTRLTTKLSGIVEKLWVQQGDYVLRGQRLATIRPEQMVSKGVETSAQQVESLLAQKRNNELAIELLEETIAQSSQQKATAIEETNQLQKALAGQKREIEAALTKQASYVTSMERIVEAGYSTRNQLFVERRVMIDFRRQLGELEARSIDASTNASRRLTEIEQRLTSARNNRLELLNQISSIDTKLDDVRVSQSADIVAPIAGAVVALPIREGAEITNGKFVAALAEKGASLRIILDVPSKAMGLIKVGNRVNLKYDAFPYKTFGIQSGRIASVSTAPVVSAERKPSDTTQGRIGDASFHVEVLPESTSIKAYGESRPILVGSTLQADIVVERRSLLDWILDPIYALKGRS